MEFVPTSVVSRGTTFFKVRFEHGKTLNLDSKLLRDPSLLFKKHEPWTDSLNLFEYVFLSVNEYYHPYLSPRTVVQNTYVSFKVF